MHCKPLWPRWRRCIRSCPQHTRMALWWGSRNHFLDYFDFTSSPNQTLRWIRCHYNSALLFWLLRDEENLRALIEKASGRPILEVSKPSSPSQFLNRMIELEIHWGWVSGQLRRWPLSPGPGKPPLVLSMHLQCHIIQLFKSPASPDPRF